MITRRVEVNGQIGKFRHGQILQKEEDIVKYLRTVLYEGAEEQSTLSDEEILTAFRTAYDVEGKWDEDIETDFIMQSLEM